MRLGTWIACGVGIVTLAGTPLAAAKDPASPGAKALAEAKAHAAQRAWKDAGEAFGRAAGDKVRSQFLFEPRMEKMLALYEAALGAPTTAPKPSERS
jgi:hypothetical protein